jgi:hypothetical protein
MRLYLLPGPGSLHMYILLLDLFPCSYTDWNVKFNCCTHSDAMVWNELQLHAVICLRSLVLRDRRNLHL